MEKHEPAHAPEPTERAGAEQSTGRVLLRPASTCEDPGVRRRSPAEPRSPDPAPAEDRHPLEDWLPDAIEVAEAAPETSLGMARIVSMGPPLRIAFRGSTAPIVAELDEGVDCELVAWAMRENERVLVERSRHAPPLVVGLVQRKTPSLLTLKAAHVVIEGEREVLLKSGLAALRLREDGDVELVGSRIVSASRGLYRLVGRVLRLN